MELLGLTDGRYETEKELMEILGPGNQESGSPISKDGKDQG